jgi:two-component system, NarL family, invasion response regulator UvrY
MTHIAKILLIEDHALIRAGCRRVLRATGAMVLEAVTGAEGLQINREQRPDIVFLDISLPDVNGATLLERLRADSANVHVIMLTMYEDRALADRLMKRGASGYVTKRDSPECMLQAIKQVCAGGAFLSTYLAPGDQSGEAAEARFSQLSPRDQRIVELLGQAKSLSEIAYELGQSYKTIANLTNMIRRKIGLRTNAALAKFAIERRLAQPSSQDGA